MSSEQVNIPSGEDDDWIMGVGAYRVLESYAATVERETVDHIKLMMKGALTSFPELTGETVNVGGTPDTEFAYARAFVTNRIVCLPRYEDGRRPWWDLLYHELSHLAIEVLWERGEDVPHTSEEFCSIFSTARIPVHRIEWDYIDYLGEPSIPKEEWPEKCQMALNYRERNGPGSHYIKKCKEWLGAA